MKKFLKLKAAVLSIAMLLTSISGVYAAEGTPTDATDGYYWLEAEDCADKHVSWQYSLSDYTTPNVVSGSGWGISQSTYPGEDGYYIDFNINVENAGSYDLWIYGGRVANTQWISAGKIKVDGADLTVQPAHFSRDDWAKLGASSAINIGWSKASAYIEAGEKTIRYYISDVVAGDNTTYQGALDLICVVPSYYGWEPTGTGAATVKPSAPDYAEFTDGYLWLEAEQYSEKSGSFTTITDGADKFTDGKALLIRNDAGVIGTTRYSLTYLIDVPETGVYDININGTKNGADWVSPIKVDIDGASYTLTASGSTMWYGDWAHQWNNTEVNLTAGKHIVTIYTDEKAPASTSGYLFRILVDAMCIVPADWDWTPSITSRPVAPVYLDFTDGYLWAEGENACELNGISASSDSSLSDGKGAAALVQSKPSNGKGFYADFNVKVPEDGDYIVYFRGTYDDGTSAGQWSSNPVLKVDGTEKSSAANGAAVWFGASGYYGGWRESEVISLTKGKHTVRWGIEDLRRGGGYYAGLIDAVCIAPADWGWIPDIATRPEKPVYNTYLWLEETNASFTHSAFAPFQTPGSYFYGGNAKYISTPSAAPETGYNIDFEVNMLAGEYDIYFRGTCGNEWVSEPSIEVNGGEEIEATLVVNEGYDVKDNYHIGWKKATVFMVQGKNVVRWTLHQSRTASTSQWYGAFDAMVIVPKGAQFTPVKLNIAEGDTTDELSQTKLDYELAIAMDGIDFANVKNNLSLPAATQAGDAIEWTTNNASVIAADGTVTRPTDSDKTVVLTAVCNGYAKNVTATVKKIKVYDVDSFAISGTIASGDKISATADITYNLSGSKEVMLIVALYAKDNQVLTINMDKQDITSDGKVLSAEITVPSDVDLTDAYAKAFLWNGIGDLKPIENAIDL